MANYDIRGIYKGAESSLESTNDDRLFTGYSLPSGQVGVNINPMTANQVGELNKSLNQGIIAVEVGTVQPDVFDTIPKHHFTEIRRMAQLTGSKVALHAPIVGIEPSGLDPQGGKQWTEQTRQMIENQLKGAVDKAVELDKNGGVPITIHASNIPLAEWQKIDGKIKKTKQMIVNQETGQISVAEERDFYSPRYSQKENFKTTMSPEGSIENQNATSWSNSIEEVLNKKERVDEILREVAPFVEGILPQIYSSKGEEFLQGLKRDKPTQYDAYKRYTNAQSFLEDLRQSTSSLFGKAYKYNVLTEKDEEEKKKKIQHMNSLADEFKHSLGIPNKNEEDLTKEEIMEMNRKRLDLRNQSQAMHNLIHGIENLTPQIYVSATDFATEKSSDTFANVALHSYELAKKKSHDEKRKIDPSIVSIENLYPELGFSRGEDMKNLIQNSRKKFAKKLMKKEKISESKAREMAEKVIGMTFDVGHLNMFKKQGFSNEDLRKEAEEIKKFVKHVHITDNFGYADTHLPPGMGNVPIGELMKEIEARDFKGKFIVEAGGFIQHFGRAAYIDDLEGLGSPIFKDGVNNSYWSQSSLGSGTYSGGLQRGYFGGFGGMLPQLNYETFGAGFSNLPVELGGSRQGGGGRMSGTPME